MTLTATWTIEKQRESSRKAYRKLKETDPEGYARRLERGRLSRCKRCLEDPAHIRKVQKEWRDRHPEKVRAMNKAGYKKWIATNKKKQRVERFFRKYCKQNGIVRPTDCSQCGSTLKIEAHHPDYDKPLDVVYLCHVCHVAWHRREA